MDMYVMELPATKFSVLFVFSPINKLMYIGSKTIATENRMDGSAHSSTHNTCGVHVYLYTQHTWDYDENQLAGDSNEWRKRVR